MKLSFNEATTLKNSNLELDLKLCEENGFKLIEIQLPKLKEYLEAHSLQELVDFFKTSKVKPYSFNAIAEFAFVDEKKFQNTMKELDFICEVGKAIGCNNLITIPAFGIGHSKTKKEILEEHVRAIRIMDERCRQNGIVMNFAIEFCGMPFISITQLGFAYDVACATNMDNVGIVLDCFHFHSMSSSFEDLERMDIKKLFILHIDDSEDIPAGTGTDEQRLWPGDGCINLSRIFGILKNKGWEEAASIEIFRPEYYEMQPEETFRVAKQKSIAALKEFWDIE